MAERPILHHYDASPFTQKALRMLGLKGLDWDSVETPMIMPKPDLTVLTGGYRGTPVLQFGADVYVDNMRIATELERRYPQPSLFPDGNPGLHQALVKWSDAFFRCSLYLIIATQSRDWPEEFLADRKDLFFDIDFDAVSRDLDYHRAQLRAHAALLDQQLADGRDYLAGDSPSLADIHAFSVPWVSRAAMPEVNELFAGFTRLAAWEERVAAIGEGRRNPVDAAAAHAAAQQAEPVTEEAVDAGDAQDLQTGQAVTVAPDDARRGAVTGNLVLANALEVAVRHGNDTVGEVVVHFPRLGYRITPA